MKQGETGRDRKRLEETGRNVRHGAKNVQHGAENVGHVAKY